MQCNNNVFHVLFHEDSLLSAHDFPSEMNENPTFFYFFNILLEDEIWWTIISDLDQSFLRQIFWFFWFEKADLGFIFLGGIAVNL